jgi:protease-4
MLSYPFYAVRYLLWLLGKLKRRFAKGPAAVLLTLEGDYPQVPIQPSHWLIGLFRPPGISLLQLGEQFRLIASDARVQTVILNIRPLAMPLAKIDVLRGYIQILQEAGKRVLAWSYHYELGSYYLASTADEIMLLPGGDIGPLGISQEYIYLADALERVGVQADYMQITPYKSAGDMFTRSEMSEQVREMGSWLADSTWDGFIQAVAIGRDIAEEQVRKILNDTPYTDLDAVEVGLIDAILHEEELPAALGNQTEPQKITPWKAALGQVHQNPPHKPGKYVALMGIEGIIVDGGNAQPPVEPPLPVPFGFEKRAGNLSVSQMTRQVLADKRAGALVVYVDSRGGSATASESISAALAQVAEQIPVLVAFGPVAASGGYYVATPAAQIFAQPNTITGSIGVIIGKFEFEGLLKNLSVNLDRINRGEAAGFYDPQKKWSEAQRAKVWNSLMRIYNLFLHRVAESRQMEANAVDEIGGGRVWTGRQALDHNLVDALGGLDQALAKARELAGLREDAAVRLYTPGKGNLPPIPDPAVGLRYAVDNFKLLSERAMLIMPWLKR